MEPAVSKGGLVFDFVWLGFYFFNVIFVGCGETGLLEFEDLTRQIRIVYMVTYVVIDNTIFLQNPSPNPFHWARGGGPHDQHQQQHVHHGRPHPQQSAPAGRMDDPGFRPMGQGPLALGRNQFTHLQHYGQLMIM